MPQERARQRAGAVPSIDGATPEDLPRRDRQIAQVEDALTEINRIVNGRAADRVRMQRAGVPVTKALMSILRVLHERGPMRVNQLGTLNHMDKGYVSRAWRSLEADGYVEVVGDPQPRSVTIGLTEQGRAAYLRWRQVNFDILAEVLEDWDTDDLGVLAEQLERLSGCMTRPGPGGE